MTTRCYKIELTRQLHAAYATLNVYNIFSPARGSISIQVQLILWKRTPNPNQALSDNDLIF